LLFEGSRVVELSSNVLFARVTGVASAAGVGREAATTGRVRIGMALQADQIFNRGGMAGCGGGWFDMYQCPAVVAHPLALLEILEAQPGFSRSPPNAKTSISAACQVPSTEMSGDPIGPTLSFPPRQRSGPSHLSSGFRGLVPTSDLQEHNLHIDCLKSHPDSAISNLNVLTRFF
jgi:hypothetical protein